MTTKDLRIGSLGSDSEGRIGFITALSLTDGLLKFNEPYMNSDVMIKFLSFGCGVQIGTNFKPIALTEPWITALGLEFNPDVTLSEHHQGEKIYSIGEPMTDLEFMVNIDDAGRVFQWNNDANDYYVSSTIGAELKYVHELQNRYHSFTGGKELAFSKGPEIAPALKLPHWIESCNPGHAKGNTRPLEGERFVYFAFKTSEDHTKFAAPTSYHLDYWEQIRQAQFWVYLKSGKYTSDMELPGSSYFILTESK